MSNLFSIEAAPDALREIARFAGIPALLDPTVQDAMARGAKIFVQSSRDHMHWKKSSGALSNSMYQVADSPYEIIIGSDLPYAGRRDRGFDGPDSLGRVYHDQGAFFLEDAIEEKEQDVLILVDEALFALMARR